MNRDDLGSTETPFIVYITPGVGGSWIAEWGNMPTQRRYSTAGSRDYGAVSDALMKWTAYGLAS